jgi:hypothetical protein
LYRALNDNKSRSRFALGYFRTHHKG